MMQSTLRVISPLRIQQLWDCFTGHGPRLGIDRFASLDASLHKIPKDIFFEDLKKAVKDGLILAKGFEAKSDDIVIYTGSPIEMGEVVVLYKLPEFSIEKGDHDWYCFYCHLGGPIVKCEDCPRVFHLECLPEDRKPHKDPFICPPCHMLSTKSNTEKMGLKTKQLNTLITYILDRFRKWVKTYKIDELDRAEAKVWVTRAGRPAEETWRFDSLVYTPMDLNAMYEKAISSKYKSIEEFQVDCETLYHGIATFFGIEATKGDNIGAVFHRDITHEINELIRCHDCFRLSNEKNHPWWFCLPCTTPHEVVFAKQTRYPFWPAKVLKKEENKYNVRFFGGNYERAIIDAKNIMPIDTPVSQLKIRKTAAWNEAFDEVQKFQDIARNPDLVNSLPASRGRFATPATKSPKANAVKRQASEPPKVTTSKKAKVESANSTPARGRASTSTNGMPDARKKIIRNSTPSTPKPALTRRENNTPASSSATPAVATKRADSTGSGDKFLVPETIEEIQSTIDSFFKSSRDGASNADVNYSDDEDDKMSDDKASEDAVSSSVNESGSNRSAYVQTNTEFIIPKEAKNKIQNFILAMKDSYYQEISANKKKQWCFNCEREAIYHCCWNTAYCSTECQQQHWTKEHKKQCRRIRQAAASSSTSTAPSTPSTNATTA